MDFLGMGTGEILLIIVVALIIWGPDRIVEIGRTLGKMVSTLRKTSFDLTKQISKELEVEEKDLPSPSKAISGSKPKESSGVSTAESRDEEVTSPRDQ